LIVICPDGGKPGLELLFADHLFSFARPHLESVMAGAGLEVLAGSVAPRSLGAFQMVIARQADGAPAASSWAPTHVAGRAEYLRRWHDLDRQLAERLSAEVVCFGAGEAAGLLRAYASRSWARVVACTMDGATGGEFGGVPIVPLDAVDPATSLLLGVRPGDQARLAGRLRGRFPHVVEWYDLVDEEQHG
jgi:hypothetical protein